MAKLPHLELTHGQLLWSIGLGREPDSEVRDRARYLRQLGIPRPRADGPGRGQRIIYDFDDLALLGFGLLGLTEGARPKVLREHLVTLRNEMVQAIRYIWSELADEFVCAPWTKLRGRVQPGRADASFVRLHGFARGEMAGIEVVQGDGSERSPFITPYEIIPGQTPQKVFEVEYWLPQWVAWAREAPSQPRGRQVIEES